MWRLPFLICYTLELEKKKTCMIVCVNNVTTMCMNISLVHNFLDRSRLPFNQVLGSTFGACVRKAVYEDDRAMHLLNRGDFFI